MNLLLSNVHGFKSQKKCSKQYVVNAFSLIMCFDELFLKTMSFQSFRFLLSFFF